MSSSQLAILVISCDAYSDLWEPFFTFFWRYWPDCPYPVYLGGNQKTFDHARIQNLSTITDENWSSSAKKMLEQLDNEYVLIMLEDFFLSRLVTTAALHDLFMRFTQLDQGMYLRLRPRPKPDIVVKDHYDIGEIEPYAPYRAALQAAIWHRARLVDFLLDGESAWDVEHQGSRRSDTLPYRFFSTWQPVLHYFPSVTRGQWTREGVSFCRQHQVAIDLSSRSMMSRWEETQLKRRRLVSAAIKRIPWKWRARLRGRSIGT